MKYMIVISKKKGGKMKVKDKDFTTELAGMLPPERAARARKEAEKEIFQIRLSELRKKMGIRQEDIKAFSQSSISKLEARKDIKISTLIEYLENLGLGIEIKAYQKNKGQKKNQEYVLLKI
jgi:hypothetical protein